MNNSRTAQLIELKLGRSLAKYVEARRVEQMGFRRIAEEIKKDTGIDVSHETLRGWFPLSRATASEDVA